MTMRPAVFIPEEVIPFGCLYVLHSGLVRPELQ